MTGTAFAILAMFLYEQILAISPQLHPWDSFTNCYLFVVCIFACEYLRYIVLQVCNNPDTGTWEVSQILTLRVSLFVSILLFVWHPTFSPLYDAIPFKPNVFMLPYQWQLFSSENFSCPLTMQNPSDPLRLPQSKTYCVAGGRRELVLCTVGRDQKP